MYIQLLRDLFTIFFKKRKKFVNHDEQFDPYELRNKYRKLIIDVLKIEMKNILGYFPSFVKLIFSNQESTFNDVIHELTFLNT